MLAHACAQAVMSAWNGSCPLPRDDLSFAYAIARIRYRRPRAGRFPLRHSTVCKPEMVRGALHCCFIMARLAAGMAAQRTGFSVCRCTSPHGRKRRLMKLRSLPRLRPRSVRFLRRWLVLAQQVIQKTLLELAAEERFLLPLITWTEER